MENLIPVPKLVNLGNTCYMNAVIQIFFNIEELTKFFLINYKRTGKNFADNYKALVDGMHSCTTSVQENPKKIVPLSFKNMLDQYISSFRGKAQQDSSECLIYMLEYLREELGKEVEIKIQGKCTTVYDKLMAKSMQVWKNEFKNAIHLSLTCFMAYYYPL